MTKAAEKTFYSHWRAMVSLAGIDFTGLSFPASANYDRR
jgi:hypothetical protein